MLAGMSYDVTSILQMGTSLGVKLWESEILTSEIWILLHSVSGCYIKNHHLQGVKYGSSVKVQSGLKSHMRESISIMVLNQILAE